MLYEPIFLRKKVHLIRSPNVRPSLKSTEAETPSMLLLRNVESLEPLESAAVWEDWKINVHLDQNHYRDAALYLFCVFRKPVVANDQASAEVKTETGRSKGSESSRESTETRVSTARESTKLRRH